MYGLLGEESAARLLYQSVLWKRAVVPVNPVWQLGNVYMRVVRAGSAPSGRFVFLCLLRTVKRLVLLIIVLISDIAIPAGVYLNYVCKVNMPHFKQSALIFIFS